jgi:hypothetical protein
MMVLRIGSLASLYSKTFGRNKGNFVIDTNKISECTSCSIFCGGIKVESVP